MIRVLVLGYGPMGLALTRGVQSRPDIAELVGVFPWSKLPTQETLRHEDSEYDFLRFLERHRLPLVKASSVNDFSFARLLEELKPDIVLVGSWGEILKSHVLATQGVTFINCHPSLLPQHRGPNPYVSVILEGEAETGITFHVMDTGVDTGPILHQRRLPIAADDTGETLRQKTCRLAEEAVSEMLVAFQSGEVQPVPQTGEGSYHKLVTHWEVFDWQDAPARLDRHLRAMYPWAFVKTYWAGRPVLFEYGRVLRNQRISTALPVPGRIVRNNWRDVWVETTEPGTHIRLCNAFFPDVPLWMTPLYRWTRFKRGECFSSSPGARQV